MSIAGFLSMLGDMGTSIVKRAGVSGDLMGGIAATSKTIGATTDDFVDVFGNRGANNYTAGLRTSLETAHRNLDDAALRTHFQGGGPALDDATFNEMKMAREYFLKRQEASQYDSRASFEAVQRNIREGGNPNAGYSRAGETRPESALTRIFDTEATGMGNELKFLGASALLGGGANYMTGGEFGTGAGVGAIAATGIRGAGRIIQQNMPEIETAMMKRLMGDDAYSKLTPKDFVETKAAVPAQEALHYKYSRPGLPERLEVNNGSRVQTRGLRTIGDLLNEFERVGDKEGVSLRGDDLLKDYGDFTFKELGFIKPENASYKLTDKQMNLKISDFVKGSLKGNKKDEFLNQAFHIGKESSPDNFSPRFRNALLPERFRIEPRTIIKKEGRILPEVPEEHFDVLVRDAIPAQPAEGYYANNVRTQALNAIQGMSAEQVKERGIGSSYIHKMLTNKDKGNMGRNMRVMTVSGAALAGVPFTGRRNDHSSGFNKNRGNKI